MPAPRLTPDTVQTAVLAVIAGTDLDTAAAAAGIPEEDLADAERLYRAAGSHALATSTDPWQMIRISFADSRRAEGTLLAALAPCLDRLSAVGVIDGWWFVRKAGDWRIRLLGAGTRHTVAMNIHPTLDQLAASGLIESWRHSVYEPEVPAFGGPTGMKITHELFIADTEGVLDYLRQQDPALGRREISVTLVSAMLRAAGLEWFEQGHVWHLVAGMRPLPGDVHADDGIQKLIAPIATLLAGDVAGVFSPGAPLHHALPWNDAFTRAGADLRAADRAGELDRGLRRILAHQVIFHWNRLGLSARTQAILAHAAQQAIFDPPLRQALPLGAGR